MARVIALLRGVNLGSARRLAMADLREVVVGLGYEDARTFLQSGNVVLTTGKKPATVKRELERAIADGLGVETEVFVRTRDELADVVALDPLAGIAVERNRYHVSFLSERPQAAVVRELAEVDVAPEQFVVEGRELYAWLPQGVRRSEVVRLMSQRLRGISATTRNWNTVTRLLELADE